MQYNRLDLSVKYKAKSYADYETYISMQIY